MSRFQDQFLIRMYAFGDWNEKPVDKIKYINYNGNLKINYINILKLTKLYKFISMINNNNK